MKKDEIKGAVSSGKGRFVDLHLRDKSNNFKLPEASRLVKLATKDISPAAWNARRYFDAESLEQLGSDIKLNGQAQPILVRQLKNKKRYELLIGERRLRAAQLVGLEQLDAVVVELDDKAAQRLALSENLSREDLNAYEETLGYLQLLLLDVETVDAFQGFLAEDNDPLQAVSRLLRRYSNEVERSENNVILKPELGDNRPSESSEQYRVRGTKLEAAILAVFNESTPITWQSFVKNRLPILNLPEEVLESLTKGQLDYSKARVIGRISDGITRLALLKNAIQKQWSLSELKDQIKGVIPTKPEPDDQQLLVNRTKDIAKAMRKTNALNDKRKLTKATRLLKELEDLLEL